MHFKEIIKEVAEKNNISQQLCKKILKDAFATIANSVLEGGEKLSIKGFGSFYIGHVAARKMAKTMGGHTSPGYSILKLRPSKLLRK